MDKNNVYLLKALDDIPTALVEVGFLSNPGEAARLADSNYQRQVAASIYQGILRYSSGEKLNTGTAADAASDMKAAEPTN